MIREDYENTEFEILAPYAVKSAESRGRQYDESKHPYRSEFQRDRDRIVHSTAFRRLEYKTQVFVNHEGDHYRTRLTHTIEVSIIARSIARSLRLNEDLAEAIALAHDLGHTPFGHSGEEALNELLKDEGGFEHNRQCLRVIDLLEKRYPAFPGLNLTYELKEGIFMHHSPYDNPIAPAEMVLAKNPSLECQIVNLADEIAYNCHDVDDGLSSGVLHEKQLAEVALWQTQFEKLMLEFPDADEQLRRHAMVRYLINYLVTDLTIQSESKIVAANPRYVNDVRNNGEPLVAFSEVTSQHNSKLKLFLYRNMYRHPRVVLMADTAKKIVRDLFDTYLSRPDVLPPHIKNRIGEEPSQIVVADYIAGMTDRFAMAEHDKLT
jgi:dGTPase